MTCTVLRINWIRVKELLSDEQQAFKPYVWVDTHFKREVIGEHEGPKASEASCVVVDAINVANPTT